MKLQKHKSVSIAAAAVYSLIFHAAVLGTVLTMPLYGGEGNVKPYLVYLPDSEGGASNVKVEAPEKESREESLLPPGKTPAIEAQRGASKVPKSKKVSRKSNISGKKTVVEPEMQSKTKNTAPKEKPPIMKADAPKAAPKEKSPVLKADEPEIATKTLTNIRKQKPLKAVNKKEPIADKKSEHQEVNPPLVEKEPEAASKAAAAKASAVSPERLADEKELMKEPEKIFEEPGWQEPMEQVSTEEKELKGDKDRPEPILPSPPETLLSKLYDNPAENMFEIVEPAAQVVPARTETLESFEPALDVCKDCTLVSRLYRNTTFDIEENNEASLPVPGKLEPQISLPVDNSCKDCDVVSSEYENRTDSNNSASNIDLLCRGCLMVAMLAENPAEDIMYDNGPKGQDKAAGDFLSVIDEFCSECARPLENTGNVEYRIWNPSETEIVESVEVITPSLEEEAPRSVVVEVPDVELARMVPDVSATDENHKVDIPEEVVFESPVAEILTPTDNRTPSQEDYLAALDKDLSKLEQEETQKDKEEGGAFGLPLFIPRDIEIDVFFEGSDDGVSFKLVRRPHPMTRGSDRATGTAEELEEATTTEDSGLRRTFFLTRAERGAYMFIIVNDGSEVRKLKVGFSLYRNLMSERTKEYGEIALNGGADIKIRFLMPEAIFWDDDDYFTGEIEGSDSITKFNDDTGLVWKEKSDGY